MYHARYVILVKLVIINFCNYCHFSNIQHAIITLRTINYSSQYLNIYVLLCAYSYNLLLLPVRTVKVILMQQVYQNGIITFYIFHHPVLSFLAGTPRPFFRAERNSIASLFSKVEKPFTTLSIYIQTYNQIPIIALSNRSRDKTP